MKTPSIVRVIYLYLFSLIGLCLIVIGGVRFVDMGLRAFVFTKADEAQKRMTMPPYPPMSEVGAKFALEKESLSESDKAAAERWLADYEAWQKSESERDYVSEERSRNASSSLAMILIGLPLYFYHWSVIRKESSKKEDQ